MAPVETFEDAEGIDDTDDSAAEQDFPDPFAEKKRRHIRPRFFRNGGALRPVSW